MTTVPQNLTDNRPPLWATLTIAILPVVTASIAGSAVTVPQIPIWYAGLLKPPFNPPNWIFAPVWTALYALMALGIFRILRLPVGTPGRRRALLIYHLQLLFNIVWSFAFFGANSPLAGLADPAAARSDWRDHRSLPDAGLARIEPPLAISRLGRLRDAA